MTLAAPRSTYGKQQANEPDDGEFQLRLQRQAHAQQKSSISAVVQGNGERT
jgi:hypothetical protein